MSNTVHISPQMFNPSRLFAASQYSDTAPNKRSARRAAGRLDAALDARVDHIKPGASTAYHIGEQVPDSPMDVIQNPGRFSGATSPDQSPSAININPHSNRAWLAHEMGHLASQQTDIGHLVATLRANPKLSAALGGALFTLPGLAALVEDGDNDMDTSIALAALSQAPVIADEALATKNGLAILEGAGMRATPGQRGRLAGGLMTYLAAPTLMAVGGNIIGNQFDENTGDVPM